MKSDEWIIERLKKRNESGLSALIDKYAALVKSVIQKHLYALPGHQDECLNDVFLAVWENIEQYDVQQSSFKNWICVIAKYRSINLLKKYRRDIHMSQWEEHMNTELSHYDEPFSRELWETQLEELLAPLSKKDQQLFRDIFDSNDSTEEVAQKHELTQGALYSRVSRGKAKLRAFFQQKGENHHE